VFAWVKIRDVKVKLSLGDKKKQEHLHFVQTTILTLILVIIWHIFLLIGALYPKENLRWL